MPGLIILASAVVAGIAWLGRRLSTPLLLTILVATLALSIAGVLLHARLYPLTDVLVLLVALSGGILLGRAIPARFRPFLVMLLVLSLLDAAQQLLPAGSVSSRPERPAAYFYTMFVLNIGHAHAAIGFLDLLVAAAIGAHSRRRGQAIWRAVLPAPLGLSLVYLIGAITPIGATPLIPFITLGWLVAQIPWPMPALTPRSAPRSTRG